MRILVKKRKDYDKYIQKVKVCEFCNPKIIREQECVTLSGKYWRVLVAKYPYLDGNLMITPMRHFERLSQIEPVEWEELRGIMTSVQKKLTEIFKTKAFNIALNEGKKAGGSIRHLHWQIIPRKIENMSATNLFADLYLVKIDPLDLKKEIDG